MSMSDSIAILAIAISISLFVYDGIQGRKIEKKIDEQVKKQVNEELAPYREILDAMKQKTTRTRDEMVYSMTRYNPPDDPGPITVINEKTQLEQHRSH